MQIYELGYLILPSIAEDAVSAVTSKLRGAVEALGGKFLEGEEPFKQELAYTMSKTVGASKYVANEAYVGWMKFELEASTAPEVKASLDKIDELLRFLFIKAPRESEFTFAKAKAAIAEKMAQEAQDKEDAENPIAVEELVVQ